MTDPRTFTADKSPGSGSSCSGTRTGSLPAAEWNESTLRAIATWYAKNLSPAQATDRYTQNYHKNRHRLTHRREGATVHTDAIEAVDGVWESLLASALEAQKAT
jgi:hypothetical protein